MASHTGRLYAVALALVAFFLAWTTVAARPWAAAAADPRLRALTVREAQLRREARLVDAVVARRWAAYRTALTVRRAEIAAVRARAAALARAQVAAQAASAAAASTLGASAPAAAPVRIVTLPPLTITRTS
ncbi:MAG: hypothetical protein ACYDCH_14615 [Gaiellaceae bacterium]